MTGTCNLSTPPPSIESSVYLSLTNELPLCIEVISCVAPVSIFLEVGREEEGNNFCWPSDRIPPLDRQHVQSGGYLEVINLKRKGTKKGKQRKMKGGGGDREREG